MKITMSEMKVLKEVASLCDDDMETYISAKTLSKMTGLSLPTVYNAVDKLDKRGIVIKFIHRRFNRKSVTMKKGKARIVTDFFKIIEGDK